MNDIPPQSSSPPASVEKKAAKGKGVLARLKAALAWAIKFGRSEKEEEDEKFASREMRERGTQHRAAMFLNQAVVAADEIDEANAGIKYSTLHVLAIRLIGIQDHVGACNAAIRISDPAARAHTFVHAILCNMPANGDRRARFEQLKETILEIKAPKAREQVLAGLARKLEEAGLPREASELAGMIEDPIARIDVYLRMAAETLKRAKNPT
jgi:hypothetical protein